MRVSLRSVGSPTAYVNESPDSKKLVCDVEAAKVVVIENGGTGEGGGVPFVVDSTLTLKDGVLSVNTTDVMEEDNTLPITSAGVYATVGNIETLLKTI
jgi:hypothetical protein